LLAKLVHQFFGASKPAQPLAWCPVCGNRPASFLPLPEFYREQAHRYGYLRFGKAEMGSLETYTCAQCGASDRERLYALWIEQQIEQGALSENMHVVHFAPEAALSAKLKSRELFDYKTADLLMDKVDYKVDMMEMPFEDESFDFFICSHVLEHVESDDKAIRELYRITKRGGRGILVAPISVGLKNTLEDSSVTDEAGRWRLFGQNDHVRLYAHDDYVQKIRRHGFRLEELGEEYFGKAVFSSLGLKQTSILYVVRK
jgi:SAM-dependent methyltransferase